MRRHPFANGQFYHIFNRGVDKRTIYPDKGDYLRFLKSMEEFNTLEPIGSLHEKSFSKSKLGGPTSKKLVNIICYCLNTNHYHFVLEQLVEGGVSAFIKRLSCGYTMYFNRKYKRNGVLFQGKFKSVHIDSNEYLLHVSAYVNLNDRVHRLARKTVYSSWAEYVGDAMHALCKKEIVLTQFQNKGDYKEFCENSLADIIECKQLAKELQQMLLD